MYARTRPSHFELYPVLVAAMITTVAMGCGSSSNKSAPTPTPTASGASGAVKPVCTLTGGTQYVPSTTAVNQNSCSQLMFAKYQIGVFGAVNANIIAAAADANKVSTLGNSFQTQIVQKGSARIQSFTSNLAAFLVTAYGRSSDPNYIAYAGPTIPEAHSTLNITSDQYDAFLSEVVVPALAGADPNDVTNCFAPVLTDPNFKAQVIACQ